VLHLGVDADLPALLLALALGERDDLLERRDLELAVELLQAVAEVLHRAQPLDLREGEVGSEKALVRRSIAMIAVRRREASSGWLATSVVATRVTDPGGGSHSRTAT